ncbi:TonB-dependent receptor [Kordiimonas pumila]|nr:TonB-dependent receptor [Kordiimonas pumila]
MPVLLLCAGTGLTFVGSAAVSAQAPVVQPVEAIIAGTVTEAGSERPLPGVQVHVTGLGKTAVTDDQGRYRFANIAQGDYTLRFEYVGFEDVTVPVSIGASNREMLQTVMGRGGIDEEIVVTGRRAGQARALNDQFAADNSRNVVSADQAGRFPDLNAAESLRRIPGVSVQREVVGGEGRYISIRGMDSGLNNTQVNGVNAAQPEKENRRVPLDMIQTSALSQITVHKTLTPDLDSDGIGGAVELETATAFDFAGPVLDLSVRGYHQGLAGGVDPLLQAMYATRFGSDEQFGILAAVSYADRSTSGYVFYNDEDQLALVEDEPDAGVTPLQYHLTSYENQRENISANLALNWAVSSATDLVFKASYNRLFDQELSKALYFEGGTEDYDDEGNLIMTEPGTANIFNQYEETILTQQVYTLEGQTTAGAFTFDYSLGYSSAVREEPFDNEVAFEAELESNLFGYDFSGDFPMPNLTANDRATIADPNSYELGYNDIDIDDSKNERYSAKFDVTYDLGSNWLHEIKGGVKFERSKRTLFEANVMELSGPLSLTEFGVGGFVDVSDTGAPYDKYLSLDIERLKDWRNYSQSLVDGNADFENEYVDDGGIPIDEDSYSSTEDVFSGYLMGQATFGELEIVGGVRFDHTRITSDNYEIIELEDQDPIYSDVTGKAHYTNFLPRLQANYRLSSDTVIRAAYFTSIARPEPLFISGAIEIEEDDGEVDVTVGNPGLKPAYAHNFDLSVEHYFDTVGLISAGVYAKKINNFIFSGIAGETEADRTRFENDPRLAGKIIDDVTTYTNGEQATIYGIELNLVQNFTSLPGAWGGLGVYANATFQHSEAETGIEGMEEIDFFYAPKMFYTGAVTYQKYGVEAALIYSWRDSQIVRLSSYDTPIVEEPYGSFDAQISYQVTDAIKLSVDAVDIFNSGDKPIVDERYGDGTHYLEGATYTGRTVTFGINARF